VDRNRWTRLALGAVSTVVVVAFAAADAIWPRIRSLRSPAPQDGVSAEVLPSDRVVTRNSG